MTFLTPVTSKTSSNIWSNRKVIPIQTFPENLLLMSHLAALSKNFTIETPWNLLLHAESILFLSSHPPMNLSGISDFTLISPSFFPFSPPKFLRFHCLLHTSFKSIFRHFLDFTVVVFRFSAGSDETWQSCFSFMKAQGTSPLKEGYCHGLRDLGLIALMALRPLTQIF